MDDDELYDEAGEWTDEYLDEIEEHIRGMYAQAEGEVRQKWDAYLVAMGIALAVYLLAYRNAGPGEKREALQRYQREAQDYLLRGNGFQRMIDETARHIMEVNQRANDYINEQLPAIYLRNYNEAPTEGDIPGLTFTPISEEDLERMIRDGKVRIPQHPLDPAKDVAWNVRKLNDAVREGILNGESADEIAERIRRILDMNWHSAQRIARTLVTGAQNRGRLDRYILREAQGIIQVKVWVATADSRTRDWHMDMDGQERGLHEPFVDGLGNELMYPGDPSAPGETIYNCRCTMYSEMIGVRRADGSIRWVEHRHGGSDLHDRQMAAERARRGK